MKRFFLLLSGMSIMWTHCAIGLSDNVLPSENKEGLQLVIFTDNWAQAYKGNLDELKIRFVLINKGNDSVKLFLPQKWDDCAFVFWGLETVGDTTSIGGKVDLPASNMRYVVLGKDEMFGVRIRLLDILPEQAKKGAYELKGEYRNQYGEGCFKGKIKSCNSIKLELLSH
jgi:hypothetical protein